MHFPRGLTQGAHGWQGLNYLDFLSGVGRRMRGASMPRVQASSAMPLVLEPVPEPAPVFLQERLHSAGPWHALPNAALGKEIQTSEFQTQDFQAQAFQDSSDNLLDKRWVLAMIKTSLGAHVREHLTGVGLMRLRVVNHPHVCATYGAALAQQLMAFVGDRLAQTLQRQLAKPPLMARLGEAEFVVITDASIDVATQRRLAALVCETLNLSYLLEGVPVHVSAAVGVALGDRTYTDAHDLFQCADIALDVAAARRRGSLVVFERGMRDALVHHQLLDNDLSRALERQEFELAFQPIIEVQSLTHMGFEALARWQHPARGRLYPCDFLDVAEHANLICRLDWHIIRMVLDTVVDWKARGIWKASWFVSVNLSARHFAQPGFYKQLNALTDRLGVTPQALRLELTESTFMHHLHVAREEMLLLRAAGHEIYMDDFGTGFSSLGLLHKLPFSAIKIDKCFLDTKEHNFSRATLMSTMVHMARVMGIQVVAEGLETHDQLSVLKGMQCEFAQGHLIHAAMGSEMAAFWLQSALESDT